MESVPEDETKPVPAASSSKTVDEKPAKSAKISRHRRSASAGSACHSTTQRKTSPASSVGSIDELEEMSNRSDNSDDLNDTVCVKAEESDASEDQLRKPPNAFILYRKDKNKNLRSEQPGISVESASAIIGKLWREEAEDVKAHYKKIAQEERDKYFTRKKKLQARLKRKKAEREGPGSPQQSRAASAKPKSEPVVKSEVREIIVPQSHTLSSLSPEAHSHMSFGAPTDGLFGAALPRSPRHARSFTFGAGMQQLTSLALDTHGLVSSEATGMPLSPALGRFNTDLGLGINFGMGTSASMDSLGQLGLQLGQPLSPTSMELDIAVTTAAALQSLTAMSTGDSSIAGWPTSQPSAQSEFDGMLNSLFQGDN
ncbi:hypothetical protein GGF43_003611 [Coemansia sp. RSA 2618]|nr:hypothetical protein GGF43_003611 [Coemansia sp. RSA 2618]